MLRGSFSVGVSDGHVMAPCRATPIPDHYSLGLRSIAVYTRPSQRDGARYGQSSRQVCLCHGLEQLDSPSAPQQPPPRAPILTRRLCLQQLAALTAAVRAAPAQAAMVDEDAAQRVFDSAALSVVGIADFSVRGGSEVAEGVGSGLVWDRVGPHIVTNYHCIAQLAADRDNTQRTVVSIGYTDGSSAQLPASIVATDAQHDLAVLRIDARPELVQPIKMGTSKGLKVGQSVYALGNPQGLSRTLTAGVVSGLNRAVPSPVNTLTYGAIQTDAPISGGSSGGALLDSGGRLVGISTATFGRKGSGRGSGVNFALPADLVVDIVPKLIVYGNASGKGMG